MRREKRILKIVTILMLLIAMNTTVLANSVQEDKKNVLLTNAKTSEVSTDI